MEGIACDLVATVDALRRAGVAVTEFRATGGGSRSVWWMQLKADLCDMPITVVEAEEAGALGAALLAAHALDPRQALIESSARPGPSQRRYLPRPDRRARYAR